MKKILIIEDNLELRENLAEILELAGYESITAENGKQGVTAIKSERPDLILCDVMMPELDGFGVLKIINSDPELMHIPFLFLTAKTELEDMRKGMTLGADDYITKPFDDADLIENIKIRLAKSERLQAMTHDVEGIRHFFNEAKADQKLAELSQNREVRHLQKKDTLYEKDQRCRYLYHIVSGQVKLYQISDHGKELITKICGPGEYLGLESVISAQCHLESACTMEDTEILLIPVDDVRTVLFNDRDFAVKLIQMLSSQSSDVQSQLVQLAFGSVREKVAAALIRLHDVSGDTITISREDLAAMAGTAKETVIRTLTDFKNEGLIDVSGHDLKICDLAKIQAWVHA